MRGRCLRDGCQHPSRVRGVRGSRGSRLGLVLHCLARAAAAAGSPQLRGTPRRWVRLCGGVELPEARSPTFFAVFARRRRRGAGGGLGQPRKRFVGAIWTRRQSDVLEPEELVDPRTSWYHGTTVGTYYNKTKLYYYIAFCRGVSSYFYAPHAFPTIYKSTFVCSNPPTSYLFSSPQIKAPSN